MPEIKLFANLRKLAGFKETKTDAQILRTALTGLVEQTPGLQGFILEGGQLRPHIIITINGQLISDLDTQLAPEDMIAIFPPITGG
jgi:molybdopterin synthase sulfur carrier subunit